MNSFIWYVMSLTKLPRQWGLLSAIHMAVNFVAATVLLVCAMKAVVNGSSVRPFLWGAGCLLFYGRFLIALLVSVLEEERSRSLEAVPVVQPKGASTPAGTSEAGIDPSPRADV